VFTPTDATLLQDGTLVSTTFVTVQASVTPPQLQPVCFSAGTLITTARGKQRVEDLAAGDLVLTADKGLVRVCMINERVFPVEHLAEYPKHLPVRIAAGALGQNLPGRDLVVSPQHRILIRSDVAERMFGHREILVPACQLVGQPGISRESSDRDAHYVHILLDHHAIVFAEDAPCETLYLGEQVHENLSPREISLIRAHLPKGAAMTMQPARVLVRGGRLKRLLERHARNNKPLLAPEFATGEIRRSVPA